MRIVYVGELMPGATSTMRLKALEQLGHEVVGVNTAFGQRYAQSQHLLARVVRRLFLAPRFRACVQTNVLAAVFEHKPELIYVDKGTILDEATLLRARTAASRPFLAHFNPDDAFGANRTVWRSFHNTIPLYDIHFVPRRENAAEYAAAGARSVLFELPARGFDPNIHKPLAQESRSKSYGISFVGNYESDRALILREALSSGVRVTLRVISGSASLPLHMLDPTAHQAHVVIS